MRVSLLLVLLLGLVACNSTDPEFIPDGELDCESDQGWTEEGSVTEDTRGLGSPEAAVEAYLTPFLETHGGEIVMVDFSTGSLVVAEAEVVRGVATELPAGGWLVLTGSGCDGFDR